MTRGEPSRRKVFCGIDRMEQIFSRTVSNVPCLGSCCTFKQLSFLSSSSNFIPSRDSRVNGNHLANRSWFLLPSNFNQIRKCSWCLRSMTVLGNRNRQHICEVIGCDPSKLGKLATRLAPSRISWPSCAAWSTLGTGTPRRPTAAGSSAGPPSRPSAVGGTPRTSAHARGWLVGWLIRQSKK